MCGHFGHRGEGRFSTNACDQQRSRKLLLNKDVCVLGGDLAKLGKLKQEECRFGTTPSLHWRRRSESVASSVLSAPKMPDFADESSTTPLLPDPTPFQHLC